MNIKVIKSINVGSQVFFSNFKDYTSKDMDILHIIDYPIFGETIQVMRKDDKDEFLMYNFGKDKLIELTKDPIQVGKFLVPEFAEYIDLNIEDLKRLEPWFDKLDDKHKYEKLIYKYYLINNDFVLTEEQLNEAYKIYKKYR